MKALSFNGGKESSIIFHKYVISASPELRPLCFRVLELEEFEQVKTYVESMCEQYNVKLLTFSDMKSCIMQLKDVYKVETVIMGCRRTDFPQGQGPIHEFQVTDVNWLNLSPEYSIVRHNPLLEWSYRDVWNYIDINHLSVCSLYEKGYTSLGKCTNTFPNYNLWSNVKGFKHARELQNIDSERAGRVSTPLPIKFKGVVEHGKGVARTLGYPTANLSTIVPGLEGVYYGYASLFNIMYEMVLIAGINPEFGDSGIEVHLLDRNCEPNEFYGETLKVEIVGFIRKMKRFESVAALILAIDTDVKITRYSLSHVLK